MRSTVLAGLFVMMMGCAVEGPADGADITTTTLPDRVQGTLALGGISVQFELAEQRVVIKTIDDRPVYEATLDDRGLPHTRVIAGGADELALVAAVHEGLVDGTIQCPPHLMPRFWYALDAFD